MAIVLGANRYGKAETRLFRINRESDRHTVRDLNVSSSLTGDFRAAHLDGDQANVLPTDTQKNTVFAFAKSVGVGEIEEFGLALARHFVDDYTTLPETHDRVLATALTARWTYADEALDRLDWAAARAAIRASLLERFANVHSLALQQSLWEMGRGVLEAEAHVISIELVVPNIHHIAADLAPFGLDNPGEVFHVTDRPYGLIEVTVERDDG